MMRTLLNLISFMAIVNLLAVLIVFGWLWRTDRLSQERLNSVREMFSISVAAEQDVTAQRDREREIEEAEAHAQAMWLNPPASSHAQTVEYLELGEQERQSRDRLEQERHVLMRQLQQARDEIDANRLAFERERAAWKQATNEERQRKTDEQFAQTVRLYESASPKLAKQWLSNLVADGNVKQAVAYLDAMNTRAAAKIIGELKSDAESRLATDLLERLRTFGLATDVSEEAADDHTAFTSADATEPGPG